MNFRYPLIGLCLVAIAGCTMSAYDSSRETRESAEAQISTAPSWEREAAIYTTAPPAVLDPIKPPEGPEWLRQPVQIRLSDMPFDMAVESVLAGTGIVARFDYDTDPGLRVSLNHDGTVRGALEKLAARTNYGYDAKAHTVEWQAYLTRTWTIPIAGGDYSYMIGKADTGGGSGGNLGGGGGGAGMQNTLDTSAFDVDLQQFSNTQAEALNYFSDAEASITQMVGDYGVVVPSRSSSTIMVRTTPDRMRNVEVYMDNVLNELLSQVLLEIKVIQVSTTSGADAGVNWATIKNKTRSQLEFVGDSAANVFTNSVPVAFSGARQTGSGTMDVLVQALEEQGDVSFVTEQRVLTRSGKLAELELADIQGYLARSQVTNTSDIGSSQELVPGIIQSGYTLYTYNKIFGDRVAMVVSNRSSDLEPFEQVGSEDNFIQLPNMQSNRLNVHQIVRDGTTVVAAAVRREESSTRSTSPISARLFPNYSGAEHRVMDIYVMITPRIIRDI
jgi:type IVB pilus formation R64 PilN family outer membrane protein|tara:strand:- start:10000 stop:11502 length:1503 start_codon:yes stop_codon:yes gene_type:complete